MTKRPSAPAVPRKRLTVTDYTLFAGVIVLIFFSIYRVNDVLVYNWNWQRVLSFVVRFDSETGTYSANLLLYGLMTTVRLAFWATVLAAIIGLIVGYWRTCNNLTLRIISRGYVELIRNIPPLVFIFIFFFFISSQIFPA
ncbi:MAG TPA: amino acid ABC transporter permease, partial [Rhodobacteraceae bacterium]|nr:amino acid ABC transporter permease [Paracoccaceae bacterium]